MQIILDKNIDRDVIAAAVSLGSFLVQVKNEYVTGASEEFDVDIADFDATFLEAFKKTVDKMTFPVAEDAIVWKIEKTAKTFNLENSYVRDALASGKGASALDDGMPIKVRFEIPGFSVNNFRVIDLWYNTDFNPTDIDLLDEIGITLSGNGSEFSIVNVIDCKISFSRPTSGVSEVYIIDNPYTNEIITP